MTIHVGDFNLGKLKKDMSGTDYEIQQIFSHPKYDGKSAYFDVGIIKTKDVNFNSFVQPICLPTKSEQSPDVHKGKSTELIGEF